MVLSLTIEHYSWLMDIFRRNWLGCGTEIRKDLGRVLAQRPLHASRSDCENSTNIILVTSLSQIDECVRHVAMAYAMNIRSP
jgi:hypothetical protein